MLWIPCEAAIWDYGAHRGIVTDIYVEADAWILSLRWRLENAVLYAVWRLKNAVYLLLKIDILYAAWRRLRWDKKDWYIIYITCKILWLICCWLIYIIAALERLLPAWRPAVEPWSCDCMLCWRENVASFKDCQTACAGGWRWILYWRLIFWCAEEIIYALSIYVLEKSAATSFMP